jgi:hypothetical protein
MKTSRGRLPYRSRSSGVANRIIDETDPGRFIAELEKLAGDSLRQLVKRLKSDADFLWIDPTPIRGPLTFARLRELWDAGEINGESKLFVTERDDQDKVKCPNIKAETIRHNFETGAEINMDDLIKSAP